MAYSECLPTRLNPLADREDLFLPGEETGFAVLDNAVSPPLAAAALRQASSFFALPLAHKQTIAMANSAQFRGFVELGAENTAGQPDRREKVEFASEEPPGRDDGALWERLR